MKEFVEFLGAQAPYDRLDGDDLSRLARTVEAEFFSAGVIIVEENAPTLDHIFVIRTGSVEILDRGRTVDVLGPGDTFGHISVLSGLPPPLAVRAAEDTLCYRLPDPRKLVAHPEKLRYAHYGTLVARERLIASGGSFPRLERPLSEVIEPVVWCESTESVRTVAARMTAGGGSCAVFVRGDEIGIVTDDDFRRRIATGEVSVDATIDTIASVPALAVSAEKTVSAAYLHMVEHGIHHLVVLGDTGRPVGIARVVDIAAREIRDPLVIRSAVASARTLAELAEASRLLDPTTVELWDAGVPAEHLGAVRSTMIEAIFRKIVDLHGDQWPFTELECSWLLLGSLGRREPLPNSDVDTAVIWRARDGDGGPVPFTRVQISAAVEPLIDAMRQCGLQPCPQGLNASYPLFNRSSEGWRRAAEDWRRHPDVDNLLLASTMLDGRPITHNQLAHPLRSALLSGDGSDDFAKAMTRFSITTRPPAGFVRELVVGHFGEQKGYLNLKKVGLRPIVSLARALAVRARDASGSTTDRLDRARKAGLLTENEAESLKGAFSLCYQLVVDDQIGAMKAGRAIETVIRPDTLDNLERRHLRDAFRAVNHIQERVGSNRFEQVLP
ncbi:putative nucleotidyltransferase substrate binding domain-containing protein [Rhodococcus sp. NPDC056960]|uniref:putative nucleotidyltransferase substrate binding domain-containing protein n=1 Tax=Rhodococcus sp. NPDC056960 TaxID=3345982 RepID=UPI003627D7A3